jgi:hypothetical protein
MGILFCLEEVGFCSEGGYAQALMRISGQFGYASTLVQNFSAVSTFDKVYEPISFLSNFVIPQDLGVRHLLKSWDHQMNSQVIPNL